MNSLLLILLFIGLGVALMVILGERFASPMAPEKMQQLQRWLWPLMGIALVLGVLRHYLF